MAVGFASLEIARSGLVVSERGLDVTGHNISNVNSPGYSRQQAMITTANYHNEAKWQLGLGADIQGIRQLRHTFLDNVYRIESTTLGYWETKQKTFEDVESILGDPMNDGLQKSMNQFWDSWQELSKDPASLTSRALVRQRGDAIVQFINHMGTQLDKMQNDLNSEIKVRVDEINNLTRKIAALNVKVLAVEKSGDTPNDYRDERNNYIDRLSKLVNCDVTEMQDGQVDITVSGYFLVNKGTYEELTTKENKVGSTFADPALKSSGIMLPVKSGILKGLMESRGEVVFEKGSTENGSPNNKIDLVFAINMDDPGAPAGVGTQGENLINNIDTIVKSYTTRGFEVNLGYVAYNATGVGTPEFYNKDDGADWVQQFKDDVGLLGAPAPSADTGEVGVLNIAMNAIKGEDSSNGWRNTARQVVLLSDTLSNVGGINDFAEQLQEENIHTLVISSETNRPQLGAFASITGDRFIASGTSNASTFDDIVIESMRNDVYGSVKETSNTIPDIRQRLNLIVSALVNEVNAIHSSGTTLDGKAGSNFFVPIDPFYPMQMGNIKLNDNLSNLNNIVSSKDGSPGDNTVAVEIGELRNKDMVGNFSAVESMDDFYNTTIMFIGNGGAEAQRIAQGQSTVVSSVDSSRQAIMGVSMDEEMTNMMKFQFAYNASAKVLNVLDQMIESVVTRLGIVGR